MKKYALTLALGGILLSSCSTRMYTTRSTPIQREAIPTLPLIADMKVDLKSKITGEAKTKGKESSVAMSKELALYDAMIKNEADVVIDPIFEIKVKARKATAKVTGYKGTYTDIRKPTEQDLADIAAYREAQGAVESIDDGMAGKGKGFKKKKKESKSDEKVKTIMNN